MRKIWIKIMEHLLRGPASIRELATALGLSYPTLAQAVRELVREGFCERVGMSIRLKPTPQIQLLASILTRYNGVELLGGSREKVLASLIEPSTPPQIAKRAGLAEQTVYRILRVLKGMLAVSVRDGSYTLRDEELREFLRLRQIEKALRREEAGVTIVYSDDIILKRVPKGLKTEGALTAFSRFSDFGVDYGAETRDFFIEPPTDIGADEVLVHALLASQNPMDTTMCAVFYLKNRGKVDPAKVRRLAMRLDALDLWLDLVALSRGLPLKHPERFLPWNEFVEKAAIYNVKVMPPFRLQKVHDLFEKLGDKLGRAVKAYCFGGVNLMLSELKESTKDIDLVVEDSGVFDLMHRALLQLGYQTLRHREMGKDDRRLEASGIYVCEGLPRVDLFTRRICGAFSLTKEMKLGARAMRFGKLEVGFLGLEAVFLLKSITEREGDLLDMEAIARRGVDWRLLERLYWEEEKLVGGRFCLEVLDSLEAIQERSGARIPFLRRFLRHCLEEGVKQSIGLGARSVTDLKRSLDFPDATLRRAVRALASRGEVKVTKRGGRVRLEPKA